MNSLVQRFEPQLARLRSIARDIVKQIEESALYERVVSEYEGLELRQQKWIQATLVLVGALVILVALVLPVYGVWNQKTWLSESRQLTREMATLQEQINVVRQPAPRPTGLMALPATNAAEFAESLGQYMASIGIASDQGELVPNGAARWKLVIKELSIRQAQALLFQVDGWHSTVNFDTLRIAALPDNKELLSLDASISFGSNGAGASSADDFDTGDSGSASAPKSKISLPKSGNAASSGSSGSDSTTNSNSGSSTGSSGYDSEDFGGYEDFDDLPPPTFEEDM